MFLRKIVSIAMALCLMMNGIVAAYGDTVVPVRDACLGPELVFGKAIGLDPYKHKFAALAMIGLQSELHKLDGKTQAINNVSDLGAIKKVINDSGRFLYKKWNEATLNDPAEVKCYFRDIQHVAGAVFSVPVHVKKLVSNTRQNYLLAFSTKKDAHGGFPVVVCTEDELRAAQDAAQETDAIFSSAEGPATVERYRQHEQFDKNVIKWAHDQEGLVREIDAREHIDAILEKANITVENKDKLTQNRKFYVVTYRDGDAFEKRLEKNKVTVINKDSNSREVTAYAHSSAYATYIFLPEVYSEEMLRERLAHELGVMFGCPVESFNGGVPVNEIDVRYSANNASGINLVLLGPNGAGKGTLANVLKDNHGLLHVSTGDMLRAAVEEGSEIGLEAQRYMDAGELVPNSVVKSVLINWIIKLDSADGVMFDGYPRNRPQAEFLDNELKKRGRSLDAILYFETSEEVIIERLSGRLVCKECSKIYNITGTTAPKEKGICDNCGNELRQRDDDKPETVKKRLSVYNEKIGDLLKYYEKEGLLRKINGDLSVEECFDNAAAILKQEGLESLLSKSFTVIDLDENLLTRDYAAGRQKRNEGIFEAKYAELLNLLAELVDIDSKDISVFLKTIKMPKQLETQLNKLLEQKEIKVRHIGPLSLVKLCREALDKRNSLANTAAEKYGEKLIAAIAADTSLTDRDLMTADEGKSINEDMAMKIQEKAEKIGGADAAKIMWSPDVLLKMVKGAREKRSEIKKEEKLREKIEQEREDEIRRIKEDAAVASEEQISEAVKTLVEDPGLMDRDLSLVDKWIFSQLIYERCDAAFMNAGISEKIRAKYAKNKEILNAILGRVAVGREAISNNLLFRGKGVRKNPKKTDIQKRVSPEESDKAEQATIAAIIERRGPVIKQAADRLIADMGITAADLNEAEKGKITLGVRERINASFKESGLTSKDVPDTDEMNDVLIDILKEIAKKRAKRETGEVFPEIVGFEGDDDATPKEVSDREKLIDKIAGNFLRDIETITVQDIVRAETNLVIPSVQRTIGDALRKEGVEIDDMNKPTAALLCVEIVREIGRKRRIAPGYHGKIGRSPEDALKVIAFSENLRSESFTINNYREAYNNVKEEFGFAELPVRINDTQSWRDLGVLARLGLLTVDKLRKENKYELTAPGYREVELILQEMENEKKNALVSEEKYKLTSAGYLKVALSLLSKYNERKNALDLKELERTLAAIIETKGEFVLADGTSGLIFSEKTVFDNGLGVLLPKLAQAGVPVSVIATTPEQQELIRTLNEDIMETDKKINFAGSVAELISSKIYGFKNLRRYYYLMVKGDVDPGLTGVTPVDITGLVEKIIENLGKVCGLPNQIGQLRRAARYFAIAA